MSICLYYWTDMADIERLGWLLFTEQLMLYSPSDDSGSAGNPKGKRFLTEVVKSPDPTSILYSYQKSIVLGWGLFPLVIVASSGGIGLFGLIKKARSALFPKVSSKVLIILTHIASLWCFRTNVPLFSASSQESNFQRLHGKKSHLEDVLIISNGYV